MTRRTLVVAVAALTVAPLLGCHNGPTAPFQPQPTTELEPVSGAAKGGNGGGGGGPETADLQLAGGMTGGPAALTVQNDNKRELNLQGPMTGVSTAIAASGCVPIKGNPTPQEQAVLEALLNSGPIDPFRAVMIYDKTAPGAPSDRHRLTLNWYQPSGNANYIVNVTEGVSVVQSGDDYTYSGGYVRVVDKRGPKDSITIRCDNLSTITATVTSP